MSEFQDAVELVALDTLKRAGDTGAWFLNVTRIHTSPFKDASVGLPFGACIELFVYMTSYDDTLCSSGSFS